AKSCVRFLRMLMVLSLDRRIISQKPNAIPALMRARRERPRGRAAERDQQFPPSDGDCHTPLPCEVRKCNDTTPRARCPNDKLVVDHENIQRSRLRKPLGLPTAVLPDPPDTPRCPRCGKPDVPGTCHAGLRVIPS